MDIETIGRLELKNVQQVFMNSLMEDYNICPRAAETLVEDVISFRQKVFEGERGDGQIIWYAVAIGESAGRPIKDCKLKPVLLTIHDKENIEMDSGGTVEKRKMLVSRLAWEAYEQGALLSQEDLAEILNVSRYTIRNIIADYRRQGITIPTRGTMNDMGRGVSHKTRAVELFIKDYTFSEITRMTCHSDSSIKRYLETFVRVIVLAEEGMTIQQMRLVLGFSERLIKEYIQLYKEYKQTHSQRIQEIVNRYKKTTGEKSEQTIN